MAVANQIGSVKKILVTALFILSSLWGAAWAADEVEEAKAKEEFQRAFGPGLKLKKRVEILEGVVKDYAQSAWADDALWVLGEVASRYGYKQKAISFREQLLDRKRAPKLEEFTRITGIWRTSRIPLVLRVLDRTGHRYHRNKKDNRVIPFNPLPMVANETLALAYEEADKDEKALERYQKALQYSPKGGLFATIYRSRIRRLEERIKIKQAAEKERQVIDDEREVNDKEKQENAKEEAADSENEKKRTEEKSEEESEDYEEG